MRLHNLAECCEKARPLKMKIPHFLFVFFKWEEKTKQSFLKEKENDVLMVSAGHAPDEIR